jgi:hypothetical protein
MKIATKAFVFTYDGQRDETIAGVTRVHDDHELVAQHPDCWRDETLQDELKVRSERLRELDRRAERGGRGGRSGRDGNWPESVTRRRDEERFWARMLDGFAPLVDERDPGLDAVETFDAARAAEWRADMLEAGWHGRDSLPCD